MQEEEYNEIDLQELFNTLLQGKWIIVSITAFISIIGVIYSLLLPNIYESKALLVMVPIQDLLGLFSEGRMNTPGTISNQNWSWRMESNNLQASIKEKMKKITKKANRV